MFFILLSILYTILYLLCLLLVSNLVLITDFMLFKQSDFIVTIFMLLSSLSACYARPFPMSCCILCTTWPLMLVSLLCLCILLKTPWNWFSFPHPHVLHYAGHCLGRWLVPQYVHLLTCHLGDFLSVVCIFTCAFLFYFALWDQILFSL